MDDTLTLVMLRSANNDEAEHREEGEPPSEVIGQGEEEGGDQVGGDQGEVERGREAEAMRSREHFMQKLLGRTG